MIKLFFNTQISDCHILLYAQPKRLNTMHHDIHGNAWTSDTEISRCAEFSTTHFQKCQHHFSMHHWNIFQNYHVTFLRWVYFRSLIKKKAGPQRHHIASEPNYATQLWWTDNWKDTHGERLMVWFGNIRDHPISNSVTLKTFNSSFVGQITVTWRMTTLRA